MRATITRENITINGNVSSAIIITRLKTSHSNHDYKQILTLRHMVNPSYYDAILAFQYREAKQSKLTKVEDIFKISDNSKDILHLLGLYDAEALTNNYSLLNSYLHSLQFNKRFTQVDVDDITIELTQILNTLREEHAKKLAKSLQNNHEIDELKAELAELRGENSKMKSLEEQFLEMQKTIATLTEAKVKP